jgi:hypothetical protein
MSLKRRPPRTERLLAIALLVAWAPQSVYSQTTTVASPPVVIPAAQTQQPQDRKQGAGAAAAMAAVGAAIAGLSCIELYRQAEAIQAVNPAQAAQLRAMAAQQCSQAAQSAGNAAQNKDSESKLSASEIPSTQSGTETTTATNPTTTPNFNDSITPESPAPTTQVADTNVQSDPDPDVYEPKELTGNSLGLNQAAGPADSISALKPIEPSRIGFDEQNQNSNGSGNSAAGLFSGFGLGNGATNNQNGLTAQNGQISDLKPVSRRSVQSEASTPSTESGGTESRTGEEESSAGSVLARLMGGNQENAELSIPGQIADITMPASAQPGMRSANIFEYVSYRMKKSRREGEIKLGVNQIALKSPGRDVAAVIQ